MKGTDCGKSWSTKWIYSSRLDPESTCNSVTHFSGSLIGKCNTKNTSWIDMLLYNHRNNALSNSMGFARSCSSIDEEGSVDGFDRFFLGRIEF
jgi:hypothetical protein